MKAIENITRKFVPVSLSRIGLIITLVSVLILSMFYGCEKTIEIDNNSDNDVENAVSHEDPEDYIWDSSDVIPIILNGNSITVESESVSVNNCTATITSSGNYSLSGSLTDGRIIVNTEDDEVIRLILSGVDISNSTTAPIYIENAYKTVIILDDNTENYLTDIDSYKYENSGDDEPNATVFSNDNLSIYGNGYLTVTGNYNDGITSKDGLIIKSGNITVNSTDDGIRGKDYLIVKDGNITINAGGDGLKSDNDEDAAKGYISIETGNINITSGGDAIQAATDVIITVGEFLINSGGGSNSSISTSESAKGIKAGVDLVINGGDYAISSADDAIHCDNNVTVNLGTILISTADDGIHADASLTINDGTIDIDKSFEGIEGNYITVNGGNVSVISSDDSFNATAGLRTEIDDKSCIYIYGGYIVVNSSGDGLDSNGSIVMTNGTVIIHGPSNHPEVMLDYNGTFKISGGLLASSGSSSHMTEGLSTSSSQYSLMVMFSSPISASTIFHIEDSDGNNVLTFQPDKRYQSIVFSSSELQSGKTYTIYKGGSSTGVNTDGLYSGGIYSGGAMYKTFTISSIVTNIR